MQPTDTYAPRDNNVASEDFDGEFVVLDLESGKYFSLSGGSAIVWRGLMAGHSVASLCANMPVGDPRRDGVAGLVMNLMERRLIVAAARDEANSPELVEQLNADAGPYGVEFYDDLADLLAVDPIHDVDDTTGWPRRRPDKAT